MLSADIQYMSDADLQPVLAKVVKAIDLEAYLNYRRYLENVYRVTKKHASSCSYIAFSELLGIGKSNASRLIIKGKRNLADKSAEKVASHLGLRGNRARYFVAIVRFANARTLQSRDDAYREVMQVKSRLAPQSLDKEQIAYYGDWLTPVIREMSIMKGFVGDPQWIQKKLNFPIRLEQIKKSLQLLEELGLILFDQRHQVYRAVVGMEPPQAKDPLARISYHQKMIAAGGDSLTRVGGDSRHIAGCTLRISPEKFSDLRDKIQQLIAECADDEDLDKEEIYQLNVQLFPFTKLDEAG